MRSEVTAERYAQALLEVAEGHALGDPILEQIGRFREAAARYPELSRFLGSPRVPEEKKEELIGRIFEGEAKKIMIHFVRLLLRKGRIDYLEDILALYPKLHDAKRGVLKGTLTTAFPLDPEVFARLKSKLEAEVGRTLALTTVENPEILGGFVFSTGTTLIDASVQRQLDALGEKLRSAPLA
ncbi:MAG: ATP synthase F1 subunit delta [Candidatus Manganitrophus sp.]|nr:ATP synthase F1 subunit delta [Candidatus Manganitrophus sp.]